ncbi:cellulose biosynthesis cyclic di-GMP-binding regulatory protein BcsB [Nocardioides sp. SOB77]|uniref:Cellulose biosynthesis cyclic di-GMP-binding regulatory protein BcsB n=1 Tax=Nocardioides oceani TaxID=3058369 RepID=A0ABT8FAA2_9ACTN|nr:cellulose biosynthesis cyclic di-GMP-binding regulatory protein BcsB [Nocardioides oceani]MDN4171332.1 cellulose biosynthesis cyclic di-GMP-binding regulatory protein BcsB [Nocardioides oceani]
MRYAAAVAAAAVVTGVLAPAAVPSLGATAHAARTDLPATLDTRALQTSTVQVPVPAGVDPRWVTGALTVADGARGTVLLLVDGRVVRSAAARPWQRVALPVGRDDVGPDGTVSLGVRFRPEGERTGCRPLEPYDVRLTNLALLHQGTERVDLDPARFLPAAASRVDVVVPREASDDVLSAGLAAVAALAARYPAGVPVGLTTADVVLPRTGAGQRVLRISPGPTTAEPTAEVRFGLPSLTVTGSGDELRSAVLDLIGEDAADAEDTATGTRPEAEPGSTVTRTLAELGARAADAELSGYGRTASLLRIRQDAFGGPVDRLDLSLAGAHTSVPTGSQARLDTYLDDRLVDSRTLGDGGTFAVETSVPGSRLASTAELELVLTAVPEDGCTAGTLLPLEVQLDRDDSALSAEVAGGPDAGLEAFPQVLAGRLPVALRGGEAARTAAAADAAQVVASLQRAAAYPLEVGLVSPEALLADGPGLLVGATWADTVAAGARLRPDTDGPRGAALQAAGDDEAPLLVLGTLGARSGVLRTWVAEQTARDGWDGLTGDALVSDGGAARPLVALDPRAVPGEAAQDVPDLAPDGEGRSYVGWFAAGIVVLLLLLGLQLAATLRRRAARAPGTAAPRGSATSVSGSAPRP